MAEFGRRTQVGVAVVGKVKTVVQMCALLLMLYHEDIVEIFPTYTVGFTLLYVAAVLTLWSMFVYLRAAWPILFREMRVEDDDVT